MDQAEIPFATHEPSEDERPDGFAVEAAKAYERGGIRSVLQKLNARSRFRFTAIYRIEAPLLRNLGLFDRENPTVNLGGGVKVLDETYCAIVRATDCAFVTPDAGADERLATHAARFTVISYAGVPIRHSSGARGSLCHFDGRPRLLDPREIEIMTAVAPLFAELIGRDPQAA